MTDQSTSTPNPVTIEQAAREMLAAEYEKDGRPNVAKAVREYPLDLTDACYVRAISAALRSRSDLREEAAKIVEQQGLGQLGKDITEKIRALKATPITTDEEGLG